MVEKDDLMRLAAVSMKRGGAYIGGEHPVQMSFQPLSVIDGVDR